MYSSPLHGSALGLRRVVGENDDGTRLYFKSPSTRTSGSHLKMVALIKTLNLILMPLLKCLIL